MTYVLPADIGQRPVTVVGAGTLGRRIAAVYAAGGADVHVHDISAEQLDQCRQFVSENIDRVQTLLDVHPPQGAGDISLYGGLGEAVRGAWMVVETVPEDLELKRQVMGELDRLADADAIVASNSSSLPTSQMLSAVEHRWRVLNTPLSATAGTQRGGVDVLWRD